MGGGLKTLGSSVGVGGGGFAGLTSGAGAVAGGGAQAEEVEGSQAGGVDVAQALLPIARATAAALTATFIWVRMAHLIHVLRPHYLSLRVDDG